MSGVKAVLLSILCLIIAQPIEGQPERSIAMVVMPHAFWVVIPEEASPDGRRYVCVGEGVQVSDTIFCALATERVILDKTDPV